MPFHFCNQNPSSEVLILSPDGCNSCSLMSPASSLTSSYQFSTLGTGGPRKVIWPYPFPAQNLQWLPICFEMVFEPLPVDARTPAWCSRGFPILSCPEF